jgi:hypothetical protein
MDWQYDAPSRSWRLRIGTWQAIVERWPSGVEYSARVETVIVQPLVVRAPHVFPTLDMAQAWCISAIAQQRQE